VSEDGAPRLAAADLLTRRDALRRAAFLLGGALAAPTVAGVLAGCGGEAPRGAGAPAYRLQALTPAQAALVAAVAEQILPETSTPGARTARVHEFIDRMLAEYHPTAERARFVAGLGRLEARAGRRYRRAFVDCAPAEQYAMVDALDALAYGDGGAGAPGGPEGGGENAPAKAAAGRGPAGAAAQRDPATRNANDAAGHAHTSAAGAPSGAADDAPDADDLGPKAFFRTMKELTLVGYYTSEAGATRELRVNPMGRYRADVPYASLGAAWA
jgi:hypothetical protein